MADVKISALALLAAASITATDRLVLVDDISGTPATYQVTLADIRTKLFAGGGAFASDPLTCAALTATGALTYGGVTLSNAVTGTGNMVLSASPTLTGTMLAAAATFSGIVTHSSTTTLSGALTYGGVTLSNAVTGTGNMVLSAGPTFTGTITAAAITASGLITASAGLTVANGQTLTLTGVTITGTPTWSSSQAITLSTAAQGNITSLGLLTSLGMNGAISMNGNAISNASTISASGTVTLTASGTSIAASGDVSIATTKKLGLNAGLTVYLSESSTNNIDLVTGSGTIGRFGLLAGNGANEFLCALWDVSAVGLKTLKRGASDSGGAGKRLVVVDN